MAAELKTVAERMAGVTHATELVLQRPGLSETFD